ncbi:M14 family zinc carboxypeptidase [Ammoniphilus sp. YIM 78166]|uniref:M14 family zinc carboxypeptidase n=1 Tax=Ammoniphilus sp. YIM 78166 TaxID=1644106 RepID=UPI001F0F70B3|nr:M14 family zinc carboxypeptidase [Ammoniphilus sp. YIM 78166]
MRAIDIQAVIDKVPDYQAFLTLDELDESTKKLAWEYPDVVTVFEAGRSRQGHPILGLKIGEGRKNALCFACPHPNEPIGAMTMEFLSRALAEDEDLRKSLDLTWYIIKSIDPDGVRLNEKWFKGPYSITDYTKHFFRPAGYEQVEWTFPIDYKELGFQTPLPETQALMKIIDEIKPVFMYSLHNTGFGGAYWYLSHDLPELYEPLKQSALKQGVALSLGEPEAPYVTEFSPAIYQTLSVTKYYDYLEELLGSAPNIHFGASSGDYVQRIADCVTLVTELPYFMDPRVQDQSEGEISRKEALLKNVEIGERYYSKLESLLGGVRVLIRVENPFVKLVEEILSVKDEILESKKNWAISQPQFEEKATVSQIFDNLYASKFFNGLLVGLLLRACEYEVGRLQSEASQDTIAIARLQETWEKAERWLRNHCEEMEQVLDYSVVPIKQLVRIQAECGLLVASYVSKKS